MFVDDMTLQEARDWEDELSLGLLGATTRRDTEQISNDLEDVRRRIRELSACTCDEIGPATMRDPDCPKHR